MKEIKSIVQPNMADDVIDALRELPGMPGIMMSEVHGYGRRRESGVCPDGPLTLIETVVPDRLLEAVLETITRSARTGRSGDGKVFVYDVAEVVKIRTGQRGEDAV
jgi:nitrogen regulatory protein P-II 1